jgi:hypothetical protein
MNEWMNELCSTISYTTVGFYLQWMNIIASEHVQLQGIDLLTLDLLWHRNILQILYIVWSWGYVSKVLEARERTEFPEIILTPWYQTTATNL